MENGKCRSYCVHGESIKRCVVLKFEAIKEVELIGLTCIRGIPFPKNNAANNGLSRSTYQCARSSIEDHRIRDAANGTSIAN